MYRTLIAATLCLATAAHGAEQSNAVTQLHALFEAAWEQDLSDDPRRATYEGDKRFNDRWPRHSLGAHATLDRQDRDTLAKLERIDPATLPRDERVNWELFRRMHQNRLDLYRFGAHLRAVDQLNYSGGILTANEVAEVIDFQSVRDYEDWIARLRSIDRYVDDTIALMREGMRRKNVQPRVIVERIVKQLDAHIVENPQRSPFYRPFEKFPAALGPEQQRTLQQTARSAIEHSVVPAYRRLRAFIASDYLSASRPTVGIWDSPDGEAFYANRLQWFTTTTLSAEDIHAIGQQEVARIRREMQRIIQQVGFKGSFNDFLVHLRTEPRFRYSSPEDLLQAYMVMTKRIDPLLPEFFGTLPRTPYGVRPIPAANAPDTTTAYYQPLSADGRRPGYYYVNLYKPEERPIFEIPVLTAHEAVPGHHLQQAIAKELGELPKFRRDFEATAFVEGWGLYAESLGDEMGLYADPYDKFGQLTYEMWRAVRLVIDTGMHQRRWTREQAFEFFRSNAAKSELDIANEVDRYIAWPGQATAYKIGEIRIKELRQRAMTKLGERFDKREFHDEILGAGAVPLDVLEARIDAWIAKQMR